MYNYLEYKVVFIMASLLLDGGYDTVNNKKRRQYNGKKSLADR